MIQMETKQQVSNQINKRKYWVKSPKSMDDLMTKFPKMILLKILTNFIDEVCLRVY